MCMCGPNGLYPYIYGPCISDPILSMKLFLHLIAWYIFSCSSPPFQNTFRYLPPQVFILFLHRRISYKFAYCKKLKMLKEIISAGIKTSSYCFDYLLPNYTWTWRNYICRVPAKNYGFKSSLKAYTHCTKSAIINNQYHTTVLLSSKND